jgi:hypothetical protein
MTVERADLLAHDDLDAQPGMLRRVLARPPCSPRLVVVGDRQDVHSARRCPDQRLGRLGTITPSRVHVQIGASPWWVIGVIHCLQHDRQSITTCRRPDDILMPSG